MSRSPAILLALVATACRDASTVDDPGSTDGSSTGGESSDDLGTDTGGDTEATTTLPVTATDTGTDTGDTGPQPCLTHDVCDDPDTPACGPDGVCVPCDDVGDPDTACASLDAGIDVCNAGTCVQCTPENTDACTPDAPICDDAFTCTGCSDHAQCPDSACNLFTGACLPAQVVHVDGDGGQDATTIAAGIALLGGDGVLVLHQASNYDESIAITNASTVAILAAPGETPGWVQTNNANPTLSLSNNSTALLAGLSLRNGNGVGLSLSSANAFVQRSRIVQNAGGGISASSGSDLRVENSFVAGDLDIPAVNVQSSNSTFLYTTLGSTTLGSAAALACNAPATVGVRNSIIATNGGSPGTELACGLALDEHNWTEEAFSVLDADWFAGFNSGNFLLTPSGAATFADIATWQTGDPLTDIDGDPRVAIDGATEHAGADVP